MEEQPVSPETHWSHLLAYFLGGAFLSNAFPHWVSGVSGSPFQSPFAIPPGEGLSSATVNVLWGSANFVVAYLLLSRVGRFQLRNVLHAGVAGLGGTLMALALSHHFAKFHNRIW